MLLNELQKQAGNLEKQSTQLQNQTRVNQRQGEQIRHLIEQSELQAVRNERLSAKVAQLKGMFEQAIAAQKGTHSLAAAFSRERARR